MCDMYVVFLSYLLTVITVSQIKRFYYDHWKTIFSQFSFFCREIFGQIIKIYYIRIAFCRGIRMEIRTQGEIRTYKFTLRKMFFNGCWCHFSIVFRIH